MHAIIVVVDILLIGPESGCLFTLHRLMNCRLMKLTVLSHKFGVTDETTPPLVTSKEAHHWHLLIYVYEVEYIILGDWVVVFELATLPMKHLGKQHACIRRCYINMYIVNRIFREMVSALWVVFHQTWSNEIIAGHRLDGMCRSKFDGGEPIDVTPIQTFLGVHKSDI